MGEGDWKFEEPAEPTKRSLILEVGPDRRPPPAKVQPFNLGYFVHKRKTALMIIGVVVVVIVPMLLATRPDPSTPVSRETICADVDGATRAIRRTVGDFATMETNAVSFRQRETSREVSTTPSCHVTVFGEITARWPDGSTTTEAFEAIATPATGGGDPWAVDGPFFNDQ